MSELRGDETTPHEIHTQELEPCSLPLPNTPIQLDGEAKQRIENLTCQQVADEIDDGALLLVDLREPEERVQNGAIPGAVHAPRGMLEFYADPTSAYHRSEFDPARRTILYCASGSRSAL